MEEQNNCPKPDCGRPESAHRWERGKRLSICGNSHSWDPVEVAEQRAKAKEAEKQEFTVDIEAMNREHMKRMEREMARGGPITPGRIRQPFE